jgi:hypothetical protein
MSGGGQEGGELEADGVARILGLDASEFIKPEYTAILKKLAPTLESVDLTQYFEPNANEPTKNEKLKQEVLNTSLSLYINDMDITIESDNPTGITPETIQAVLDSLNLPIDIGKVMIKLAADGLTISIFTGDVSYTPGSPLPPPGPGSPPGPRPGSPPPRPGSPPGSPPTGSTPQPGSPPTGSPPPSPGPRSPLAEGGFATREEAAVDAAERSLSDLESE